MTSVLKKACSAYLIKSESTNSLIISLFQPVQCGRDSKKIKNKEPYCILHLSHTSEKQGFSDSDLCLPIAHSSYAFYCSVTLQNTSL